MMPKPRGPLSWFWQYALAVAAVAAGYGVRVAVAVRTGHALPTYITFYPAIMVAALMGGIGLGCRRWSPPF
jgi:hypothetical protein